MRLKDKARAKAERRAARKAEPRTGHGPPIATDEPGGAAGVPDQGPQDVHPGPSPRPDPSDHG